MLYRRLRCSRNRINSVPVAGGEKQASAPQHCSKILIDWKHCLTDDWSIYAIFVRRQFVLKSSVLNHKNNFLVDAGYNLFFTTAIGYSERVLCAPYLPSHATLTIIFDSYVFKTVFF
jgi:hypothetical protein